MGNVIPLKKEAKNSYFELKNYFAKEIEKVDIKIFHKLDSDVKLVQKLMIDEKRCYLFGRNSQLNDFTVDHGSCSRVHAALVYHKHLGRTFLVDCGSTHGNNFISLSYCGP